jgi:hypothetical protein
METGFRRTSLGRIAAALLIGISRSVWVLSPHGWGTGGVLLLLVAVFVLLDGALSLERSRMLPKL